MPRESRPGTGKAPGPGGGGSRPAAPEADETLPVVVVGLAELGRAAVARVLRHPELRLSGVVDPVRAAARLPDLVDGAPDLPIAADAAAAYRRARGGVALLCVEGDLGTVAPLVEEAARAGLHVVGAAEELAHPAFVDEDLALRLDRAAKKAGVAVLGAGVSPGLVLDRLVATAAAACGELRHVEASRTVDGSRLAPEAAARLGLGLAPEAFERRAEEGLAGDPGLPVAAALLAEGLALAVDEVEEEIDPLVAEAAIAGPVPIEAGAIRGIRQVARAFDEGREVLRLDLHVDVAGVVPEVRAQIDADPPITLAIPGGIADDPARAWALVNAAPRVAAAEPGLLTVMDLPAGR